jgi:hypothetical protein
MQKKKKNLRQKIHLHAYNDKTGYREYYNRKFIKCKTNECQNKLQKLQWRDRGKEEDQGRDGKKKRN